MNVTNEQLQAEIDYLQTVIAVIDRHAGAADRTAKERLREAAEFKKYLWERGREMDIAEKTENKKATHFEMRRVELKQRHLAKLLKARKSPFFGRVDFDDEFGDSERLYIGLAQIEEAGKFYVYDWRAPISSMFYDFGLGPAFYEAPLGRINGVITGRRQFKIVDGVMERCFDADVSVADDYLQEVLSHSSSEKMKNIVTTIQHEQNQIIRNVEDRFLIVQGVAGSGKTSVALHRVAYLLYKDTRLHAGNVVVFSPNTVFTEYISDVLPDLGEENTLQTTFSDFAGSYLAECGEVESFPSFIERAHTRRGADPARHRVIEWKLSDDFKTLVEKFAAHTIAQMRFHSGINANRKHFEAPTLTAKFRRAAGETLPEKADRLADILADETAVEFEDVRNNIAHQLLERLPQRNQIRFLYADFLAWAAPSAPAGIARHDCLRLPDRGVAYEDSVAMLYLQFLLFGFPRDTSVLHVELDEAQDYTLLQMEIIARIFDKASFTVLGDVNQTINPFYRHASIQRFADAFRGRTRYVELTKAYRSTEEIVRYANQILGIENVSAIRHEQQNPVIERTATRAEFLAAAPADLQALAEAGHRSIAIITKTAAQAAALHKALREKIPTLTHLGSAADTFSRKQVILPSHLSKGLEFDAVIAYTDPETPYHETERHLHYVVATRAQHRLIVYNPLRCNKTNLKYS